MNKLYNFIRKMYVCIQFTFKMYIIYTQKKTFMLMGYMVGLHDKYTYINGIIYYCTSIFALT